jgi:hypothetical protein
LREKFKDREGVVQNPQNSQIVKILKNEEMSNGPIKRDKFGRRIINENVKTVRIIEPDPPEITQKTEKERQEGKEGYFLWKLYYLN